MNWYENTNIQKVELMSIFTQVSPLLGFISTSVILLYVIPRIGSEDLVLDTDGHSWDLKQADPVSVSCLLCSFFSFFQGVFSVIASCFHVSRPRDISHSSGANEYLKLCICHCM